MITGPTISKQLRARRIEAEWEVCPDEFVVLTATHSAGARSLVASVRRERREMSNGLQVSTYAPFQDILRVGSKSVPRYSAKALETFFEGQLASVVMARDTGGPVTAIFNIPTTAGD